MPSLNLEAMRGKLVGVVDRAFGRGAAVAEPPAEPAPVAPPSETAVFDGAGDEAKLAEPLVIGEGKIGGVALREAPSAAGIKLKDTSTLDSVQDLRNKLDEVEKALDGLSRPQARSGIFRKGDVLDESVRGAFGANYIPLQKFMADVISFGIIKPIESKKGAVEFTRDHVLAIVALFIIHSRVPEKNLREVVRRGREALGEVNSNLLEYINDPITDDKEEDDAGLLRESVTLEGAEARADANRMGEKLVIKRDSELSEEKCSEIIGKIPQISDEELRKARAWNRQTIEKYMKSLSNQTDVVYNKPKALARIVMFIAQASRRSLEKFDPELENLMELQVKRALEICSSLIRRHERIDNLARLFEVTKTAVEQNPLHFWENPVREL